MDSRERSRQPEDDGPPPPPSSVTAATLVRYLDELLEYRYARGLTERKEGHAGKVFKKALTKPGVEFVDLSYGLEQFVLKDNLDDGRTARAVKIIEGKPGRGGRGGQARAKHPGLVIAHIIACIGTRSPWGQPFGTPPVARRAPPKA